MLCRWAWLPLRSWRPPSSLSWARNNNSNSSSISLKATIIWQVTSARVPPSPSPQSPTPITVRPTVTKKLLWGGALGLCALAVISGGTFAAFRFSPVRLDQTGHTCEPIYPQCTCRTLSNISCAQLSSIYTSISNAINALRPNASALQADPNAATLKVGRFVGGIVRLAFHDAVEYDPALGLRADGCVDVARAGNRGLLRVVTALDPLWLPYCSVMSRADFWHYAAKVAIETACPYVPEIAAALFAPVTLGTLSGYAIPFRAGRLDRRACAATAALPNAEGGVAELQVSMMDRLGLGVEQLVALLGAHTLGGASAENSGYNGTWTDRPDLFTTEYYKNLLVWLLAAHARADPVTGAALQQWGFSTAPPPRGHRGRSAGTLNAPARSAGTLDAPGRSHATAGSNASGGAAGELGGGVQGGPHFFLNVDVAMVRDVGIGGLNTQATCPALQAPDQAIDELPTVTPAPPVGQGRGPGGCPLSRVRYPALAFEREVREYAESRGFGSATDEPGASAWTAAFASAFQYVGELGYASAALWCVPCTTPSCAACGMAQLCGTGTVYVNASMATWGFVASPPSVPPTASPATLPDATPAAGPDARGRAAASRVARGAEEAL